MIREVPDRMGCGPERPVSHTLGRVELARLRHCNVVAADEARLPAGFVIRQLRLPAPHARHLDATPRSSEAFLRRRMARDDPAPSLETYVPIRRAFRQTAPGTCQAVDAPLQQSTQAPYSQHPLCQPSPSEQPPAALRQYFGQHHGLLVLSYSSAWPSSSASSRRMCAGISSVVPFSVNGECHYSSICQAQGIDHTLTPPRLPLPSPDQRTFRHPPEPGITSPRLRGSGNVGNKIAVLFGRPIVGPIPAEQWGLDHGQ